MCGSLELYRQRTRRRSRGHWVRLPAGAREQEKRKGEDCLWGEEKRRCEERRARRAMTAIFSGRATGTSRSRDPCRVGSSGLGGLGGAVRQPTRGWPAALAAWLASAQRRSYGWTEVGSNPSMQLGWQCRGCPPGISAERVQFTNSLLLHSTAQHSTALASLQLLVSTRRSLS